jgi:hypothetical protein
MSEIPSQEIFNLAREEKDKDAIELVIKYVLDFAHGTNGKLGLVYDADYIERGDDILHSIMQSFIRTLSEDEKWITYYRGMGADVGYGVDEYRLFWDKDKDLLEILLNHL